MKTSKPLLTLRMLFPAAASLIVLLLGEWIARGSLTADTFISFIFPHFGAYLLAWLLLFLVWELLDWVLRIPPLATLGMAVLGCAPCAVNFYTMQLRGEPFLPWDLMQVSEAAGVASAAGLKLQTSMVVSIVLVLALTVASFFVYRGRLRQRWLPRLAGSGASAAALCLLVFGVYLQPAVTQVLGITPDAWMQDRYYRYYGVLTGFMTNLTNLEIDKPEGYSEQAVDDILDNVAESEKFSTGPMYAGSYAVTTPKEEQAKQPTIIYVMDESYWDVSELEQYGITFDTDVSQNLHALQQTSAYGRAYSPSSSSVMLPPKPTVAPSICVLRYSAAPFAVSKLETLNPRAVSAFVTFVKSMTLLPFFFLPPPRGGAGELFIFTARRAYIRRSPRRAPRARRRR